MMVLAALLLRQPMPQPKALTMKSLSRVWFGMYKLMTIVRDIAKGFVITEYWTHQCRIKDTDVTTNRDNHCYYCGLRYREWLDEKNR
jgi:hypothetical protein